MHHARAGPLADDSFCALAHPLRLSGGAFCTGLGLCRDELRAVARTFGRICSFGMYRTASSRPPSYGRRPSVVESSPPAATEVRSAHRPGPPAPSRAQSRVRHTCMRGVARRAMHPCIPSTPPCATLAAPDAPRTRISPCSLRCVTKYPTTPPSALVPRAATPWRQAINLDSIVAYVSQINGCCRVFYVDFFCVCRFPGRRGAAWWGRRS